jgi:hypothetical protein
MINKNTKKYIKYLYVFKIKKVEYFARSSTLITIRASTSDLFFSFDFGNDFYLNRKNYASHWMVFNDKNIIKKYKEEISLIKKKACDKL